MVLFENLANENEIKYNLLFENMTQGFSLHQIITDSDQKPIDYKFINVNSAFEKLTGLKKDDIIGKTVKNVLPNTENYWIETFGKVALTGQPCQYENYSIELDRYYDVWAYCPQPRQFASIVSDITDRVKKEQQIVESENKLKGYFNNAPDGVFIINSAGNYINANPAACAMTGYTKEELLNKAFLELTPSEYHAGARKKFDELTSTGIAYIKEIPYIKKDGQARSWRIDAAKIDEDQFIGFAKDITEEIKLQNKLEYAYYHDQMTELYNRQYVFDNLKYIDKEENLPLSIITADINGLRSINESFGFAVGDEIIKKVTKAAKMICTNSNYSIRWGGDDFLILLPNVDKDVVNIVIKDFEMYINQQLTDELSDISIAVGSYTKISSDISIKQAVKYADEDMLHHKVGDIKSVQNAPINMILHTLHEKNNREEMHSKRVSDICVAIGQAMHMKEEDINKLRIIGLVHDIGKIGIDENILNKPSRLTNREYGIMKQHSEIGFRILSANKQTSELAFYVLSHHERLDGTGYPNGIKGNNISQFTRILSLADSYDAITKERTYRKALSKQEAIAEIKKCSGTQFDPDIVNVFVNKVLINDSDFSGG